MEQNYHLETIGYHTCKKLGGKVTVLQQAPFPANFEPFLGAGCYYWDNNIEIAMAWGKEHYNNVFYIVKSELILEKPYFFDLVGNVADILQLRKLRRLLKEQGVEPEFLSEIIGSLRQMDEEEPGTFDFEAIRAIDLRRSREQTMKFAAKSDRETTLSPVLIICVKSHSRNNIIQSKEIEYES